MDSNRTDLFQGKSFLEFVNESVPSQTIASREPLGGETAARNRAAAWQALTGQTYEQNVHEFMQEQDSNFGQPSISAAGPANILRARLQQNPLAQTVSTLGSMFFTPDNVGVAAVPGAFNKLRQGAQRLHQTVTPNFRTQMQIQSPTRITSYLQKTDQPWNRFYKKNEYIPETHQHRSYEIVSKILSDTPDPKATFNTSSSDALRDSFKQQFEKANLTKDEANYLWQYFDKPNAHRISKDFQRFTDLPFLPTQVIFSAVRRGLSGAKYTPNNALFSTNVAQNLPAATRIVNTRRIASGQYSPKDYAEILFDDPTQKAYAGVLFEAANTYDINSNFYKYVLQTVRETAENRLKLQGPDLDNFVTEITHGISVFNDKGVAERAVEVGENVKPFLGPQTHKEWLETSTLSERQNFQRVQMARIQGYDINNTLYHITDRLSGGKTQVLEIFDAKTGDILQTLPPNTSTVDLSNTLTKAQKANPNTTIDFEIVKRGDGQDFTKFKDGGRGFIYFGESPRHSAKAAQINGSKYFDRTHADAVLSNPRDLNYGLDLLRNARIFPVWTRAKIFGKAPNPEWMEEAIAHVQPKMPKYLNATELGTLANNPLRQSEVLRFLPDDLFNKLDEHEKYQLIRYILNTAHQRELKGVEMYPSGIAKIPWQEAETGIWESLIDKMGYQGMHVSDEAGISTAILPQHANTIRSIWAKFNPLEKMSPELSAAIAGAVGTGVVSNAKKDSN